MTRTGLGSCTLAATMWLASAPVAAQEHNTFAIGAGATHRMSPDPDARGDGGFGLKWRIGHAETGWGWHYGLNWYSTNLDRDIGGRSTPLGELKIRPFLGGYGYTHRLTERLTLAGDVIGGFAFSAIELTPSADAALHVPAGQNVRVLTGSTPVLKPEVSVWYDLSRKFGISVDAGYILARPKLTIASPGLNETERIRADAFTISSGFVYRIF